ncbi:MAG TPA: penicillin-binding protein 2, partial [Anaerolineae bacterium]|nr:penicillin-binding protein 2 [Anaerolineae bacterium]
QLPRGRFALLIMLLIGLTISVVMQVVRYQVFQHALPPDLAGGLDQSIRVTQRGRIWDRTGSLLANDEPRYAVMFDPIRDQAVNEKLINQAARDLTPVLNMSPADFRSKLGLKDQHLGLIDNLTADVGKQVNSLQIPSFSAASYWGRAYPEGTLAASVLGFVNAARIGFYGVEGRYNNLLSPQGSRPGADLVLTIDRTAQSITEEELANGLRDTGAEAGSIIVMNPRTGEILAIATAPGYDPNHYSAIPQSEQSIFVDPAVSVHYEPGSVFKILTFAAGIDSGTITPQTTYYDTACTEVGGQTMCNWDRAGHGLVTMVDMMARSLNVGAAYVSTHMGQQNFYRYLKGFGVGKATGVDLQNEDSGELRTRDGNPDNWSEGDLGTNAFGQGLSTTPLQLIAAVAAVANDGVMVQPHVVKQIRDGDQIRTAQIVELGRPISAQTAHTVSDVLVQVVQREVSNAQVSGYRIAGKTGTAQIALPGGYDPIYTIASFIGYAPADNPQVIILVKLDRPTSSPWGSETAAPVFQKLATRLFPILGILPSTEQLAINN